jgi:hypothetical protein
MPDLIQGQYSCSSSVSHWAHYALVPARASYQEENEKESWTAAASPPRIGKVSDSYPTFNTPGLQASRPVALAVLLLENANPDAGHFLGAMSEKTFRTRETAAPTLRYANARTQTEPSHGTLDPSFQNERKALTLGYICRRIDGKWKCLPNLLRISVEEEEE